MKFKVAFFKKKKIIDFKNKFISTVSTATKEVDSKRSLES